MFIPDRIPLLIEERKSEGRYPKANFTTNPIPGGLPLEVVRDDLLGVRDLIGTERAGTDDYCLNQHLSVSSGNIWVSDGHRYLPVMERLAQRDGQDTRRILSIDADYFSRVSPPYLETSVGELLDGVLNAPAEYDLVVVDMHEDTGNWWDRIRGGRQMTDQDVVLATDAGEIRDDNFIPYMGERKTLIVKPPRIEFRYTLGKRDDGVNVVNSDLLRVDGDAHLSAAERFDMVHLCTSPGYISKGVAFRAIELIKEALVK